jgi:hypothetical protein
VHALVLSLLSLAFIFNQIRLGSYTYSIIRSSTKVRQMLDMDEKANGDKHSSLFCLFVSVKEKGFMRVTPGQNVIELFTSALYECL